MDKPLPFVDGDKARLQRKILKHPTRYSRGKFEWVLRRNGVDRIADFLKGRPGVIVQPVRYWIRESKVGGDLFVGLAESSLVGE